MNVWVWVLSYTVLGSNPEHHTIGKYQTQQECEQVLALMKEEKKQQKKKIVGFCHQTLKEIKKT